MKHSAKILGAAALLTAVTMLISGKHPAPPRVAPRPSSPATATPPSPTIPPAPGPETYAAETRLPATTPLARTAPAQPLPATLLPARSTQTKPEIQDPDARVALSLVGADPAAESYWIAAINDPSLSAHERKDLIEDLNEDGLADTQHPEPQDLPLIISRIQLIEELAPLAMDEVNANAFAEAYKDLNNLLAGQPPQ